MGGTGLNLTAADDVFILDPWWNPTVEAQAIDRAHRIGRTRPVIAYRLVCRDSVEPRILEMQEQKRELAEDVLGQADAFLKKLDPEQLRALLAVEGSAVASADPPGESARSATAG